MSSNASSYAIQASSASDACTVVGLASKDKSPQGKIGKVSPKENASDATTASDCIGQESRSKQPSTHQDHDSQDHNSQWTHPPTPPAAETERPQDTCSRRKQPDCQSPGVTDAARGLGAADLSVPSTHDAASALCKEAAEEPVRHGSDAGAATKDAESAPERRSGDATGWQCTAAGKLLCLAMFISAMIIITASSGFLRRMSIRDSTLNEPETGSNAGAAPFWHQKVARTEWSSTLWASMLRFGGSRIRWRSYWSSEHVLISECTEFLEIKNVVLGATQAHPQIWSLAQQQRSVQQSGL